MDSFIIILSTVIIITITITIIVINKNKGVNDRKNIDIGVNRDCKGEWSNWSPCSENCGGGQKEKTYTITTPKVGSGSECEAANGEKITESCNTEPCPIDCVGSWSGFGSCSEECGGGQKEKTFTITTPRVGSGSECEAADGEKITESCNTGPCPVDCVGSWSGWGDCSEECGSGGTQTREYTISKVAENGGAECIKPHGEIEERNCNEEVCPVDCVGEWGNWSVCSKSCADEDGPGIQKREYSIRQNKVGTGAPCIKNDGEEETRNCNEDRCPIHCNGSWGDWSTCTKSCDDGSGPGTQERTYTVTKRPEFGGSQCLLDQGSWNEGWWNIDVDTSNLRNIYDVYQNKRLNVWEIGIDGRSDHQNQSTLNEAMRLCYGDDSCGGFTIDKNYFANTGDYKFTKFTLKDNSKVMVDHNDYVSYVKKDGIINVNRPTGKPESLGDDFDPNGIRQERQCNMFKCPEDCNEGWGGYGACLPNSSSETDKYSGEKCGEGEKTRNWVVHSYPQYGGETCSNSDSWGNTEQRTSCSLPVCSKDCVTGFPREWSDCSTAHQRCEGVQKKEWSDIESHIGGGRCPEGSYKECNYSHECDDYTINGNTVYQKCYEKNSANKFTECIDVDPADPFNSGCQGDEGGECHIIPEVAASDAAASISDPFGEDPERLGGVYPYSMTLYRKCRVEGAPDPLADSTGAFPRSGPGMMYYSCDDVLTPDECENRDLEDHCFWEGPLRNAGGRCKEKSCSLYDNDAVLCDENNCDYDYGSNKCEELSCGDLWDSDCRNRPDCEWDNSQGYCIEKDYPCVTDSKMAENRRQTGNQNCTDDPQWESIDGYKCEDIGSAIIKSECSSGLLYTYNKNGVRVDDACPSSCEVEGCRGSSASSVPSYVDDV